MLKSAFSIWESLKVKCGWINGMLIFQLKRSLFIIKQCEEDLTTYYTKVQIALDELRDAQPLPTSIGEARKELKSFLDQDKLIMFLNRLTS